MKTLRFLGMMIVLLAGFAADHAAGVGTVEQWGMFELVLPGPTNGNPFTDVHLAARFTKDFDVVEVRGFYDGDGVYRVRFMPPKQGVWKYTTISSVPELDGETGELTVTPPGPGNHGPVRVMNTFHFAYADGTPFKPLGTTLYAWIHQPEELQEQTLRTLAAAPFNKVRMCVFPKRYSWNTNEPALYPFEGRRGSFDFSRFNPAFFRHLERRILDLQKLGIEADLILFHPYDEGHWGFDRMTPTEDDRYLRYVVARLAAFRNVWWSLANEWDFMSKKSEADFIRFGELVSREDPFHHLLSVHNGYVLFNYTLPWITHASIQNGAAVESPVSAELYRSAYRKPVIYDEIKYEGDIPKRWGNISAEELVFRFWNATVAGTYATHGETYLEAGGTANLAVSGGNLPPAQKGKSLVGDPTDSNSVGLVARQDGQVARSTQAMGDNQVLWWSKGGVLKGQSPARLAFLRKVLEDAPPEGIEPIDKWQNPEFGGRIPDYYLVYLGKAAPTEWEFKLPRRRQGPAEGMRYTAEVLDTWNMTVTPVPGTFTLVRQSEYFFADKDGRKIQLPGKPYIAIRIKRVRD